MKNNLGENICIDLGSAYTRIYMPGKGIVLNENTSFLKNIHTNEIAAFGADAVLFDEALPKTLTLICPIRRGCVCDVDIAAELLSRFISKVRHNTLVKPRVMLSVPGDITEVEGKAFASALMGAGARQVIMVSSPMVSALGAGCDITLPRGLMLMDIGAEKTDIAVISHCKDVISKTLKIGGKDFTDALRCFVLQKFKLEIGQGTAEKAKKELGIFSAENINEIELCGKDISNHMPRKITLSAKDTVGIYDEITGKLSSLIKDTLASSPTELASGILSDGLLLTGGGSQLLGLAEKLKFGSGIKTFTASEPELCCIKGTGLAFEHLSELPDIVQSYHNL